MVERVTFSKVDNRDAFWRPFFAFVLNFAFNTYKIRGY